MGRKKDQIVGESVLFDVYYVDGTRTSNRKVPTAVVDGLDGDEPARAIIEEQDRKIGQMSGAPRAAIKTIVRTPGR